jgi:hypothetical protein
VAAADCRVRGAPQAAQERPPSLTVSQTAHFQSLFIGVGALDLSDQLAEQRAAAARSWSVGGRPAASAMIRNPLPRRAEPHGDSAELGAVWLRPTYEAPSGEPWNPLAAELCDQPTRFG